MIEENGHIWDGMGNHRCRNCQMKYGYYLDIKRASREQPKRDELKEWMKCKAKQEEEKDCHNCHEKILASKIFCPHCEVRQIEAYG